MTQAKKLTAAQLQILKELADTDTPVNRAYERWMEAGKASVYERILLVLVHQGLVDWSGPISDVFVTDAGLKRLGLP